MNMAKKIDRGKANKSMNDIPNGPDINAVGKLNKAIQYKASIFFSISRPFFMTNRL